MFANLNFWVSNLKLKVINGVDYFPLLGASLSKFDYTDL